ncbi:MAG: hypothetical protein KJO91_00505 [Gammaproteobacteria bacterium]|nr:hypothetical protein [Gammaproteobacteria bacterium]
MTTQVNIPYIELEGDGTITDFAFNYPIVENVDLIVLVDGVLQIEYTSYTLDELTENGGEVIFTEAPADGASVLILRRTTMTQNVDYETDEPFQAETHEWNLDKITYILQELITGAWGGVDANGDPVYLTFDLDADPDEYYVTVTNTGGTDADLPMWTSNEYAGVYAATVDEAANIPADESATTKPDGYIWIGI